MARPTDNVVVTTTGSIGTLRVGPASETLTKQVFDDRTLVYLDLRLASLTAALPWKGWGERAVQLSFFCQVDESYYRSVWSAVMASASDDLFNAMRCKSTLVVHADLGFAERALVELSQAARQRNLRVPVLHRGDGREDVDEALYVISARAVEAWRNIQSALADLDLATKDSQVEAITGRKYVLGDCAGRPSSRPGLTYEWNGHLRTWRWTRAKMEELLREGRLVHSRSGLPRIKRYQNSVETSPSSVFGKRRLSAEEVLRVLLQHGDGTNGSITTLVGVQCSDATGILAAQAAGRSWISATPSHYFAARIRSQIFRRLGYRARYSVEQRETARSALALASSEPAEFKYWVIESIGATFTDGMRSKDLGADGYLLQLGSTPIPVLISSSALDQRGTDRLLRQFGGGPLKNGTVLVAPEVRSRLKLPDGALAITARDIATGRWYERTAGLVRPRTAKRQEFRVRARQASNG